MNDDQRINDAKAYWSHNLLTSFGHGGRWPNLELRSRTARSPAETCVEYAEGFVEAQFSWSTLRNLSLCLTSPAHPASIVAESFSLTHSGFCKWCVHHRASTVMTWTCWC